MRLYNQQLSWSRHAPTALFTDYNKLCTPISPLLSFSLFTLFTRASFCFSSLFDPLWFIHTLILKMLSFYPVISARAGFSVGSGEVMNVCACLTSLWGKIWVSGDMCALWGHHLKWVKVRIWFLVKSTNELIPPKHMDTHMKTHLPAYGFLFCFRLQILIPLTGMMLSNLYITATNMVCSLAPNTTPHIPR